MSGIVDANGREFIDDAPVAVEPEEITTCSTCGSGEKQIETRNSLGGWWKRLCNRCGTILASGRKTWEG